MSDENNISRRGLFMKLGDSLQWTGRDRSCRTVRTISLFFGHARTLGILPVLGASRSRKRIPRG